MCTDLKLRLQDDQRGVWIFMYLKESVIIIYLLQKLSSCLLLLNVKILTGNCNWTICGLALSLMLV